MPLTRPTLINVPAFDATQEFTFTFSVTSSTAQIVANRLVIKNNETNETVYDEKQETFRYEHIVNAEELTNGVYYNAVIYTYDSSNNESPASVPIQFWCYTEPTITFTNLPLNNIIPNASFNFQFTYAQNENEALDTYIVNLYNSSQILIGTSGEQYVDNGTPPYNGSYIFAGFENATVYFIEIVGVTVERTQVTTGLQQLTVQYTRPDLFTTIELTNNACEGYITIRSNIVLIEGTSNPDPPTYIDEKEVDLRQEGSWVDFNKGLDLSGDWYARAWFRDPNQDSQLIQFSNTDGQTITVTYRLGYENVNAQDLQAYLEVHVSSVDGFYYYIFSNFLTPLNDDEYYTMAMKRIGNIYNINLLSA